MAQVEYHTESTVVQNMIKELHEVAHYASSCAVRCIENAGEDGMDMCARMCLDAESLSEALAALAARGSPHAGNVAGCAQELLSDCADHCSKMSGSAGDGKHTMEQCAKACRAAAESCKEFTKLGR